MKHRTLTLVIFLLLCASFTTAMPEGMDHQEPELFDEFAEFATDAWTYIGVSLEPVVEVLYETAANGITPFNLFDGGQSTLPDVRDVASQGGYMDGQDIHLQPHANTLASYEYHETIGMGQQPDQHLPGQGVESQEALFPELTAATLDQLHAQDTTFPVIDMRDWTQNSSYVAGQRVEPNLSNPAVWNSFEQDSLSPQLPVAEPSSAPVAPLRTLLPAPIRQPVRAQNTSRRGAGRFRCRHAGCHYAGHTEQDLRHHVRYHIPMEQRPHQCPRCHQRFLSPREVQRHLPTHGLGRRYYCHVSHCPYATRGFGRKDHLTRHVRSRHGADSVMQSTDTNSTSG